MQAKYRSIVASTDASALRRYANAVTPTPRERRKVSKKLKQKPDYGPVKNGHTCRGSNHSMNPDRTADSSDKSQRTKATITHLRMYKTQAKIERNRKWFGNTRIIGQEQLRKFQANLGKVLSDPFQVIMKQTKLPLSLLSREDQDSNTSCDRNGELRIYIRKGIIEKEC